MIATPSVVSDANYANAPLLRHSFDNLTIEGWSRAAISTYWRVKELKILFDHGTHSWDFAATPNIAISHVHPDHLAGLPSYISTRHQLHMQRPKVFVPAQSIDGVRDLLESWRKMTGDPMDCDLIGCSEGDELKYLGNYYLAPFNTKHSVPSLGYVVLEKRQKLRKEYRNKTNAEMAKFRAEGADVSYEKSIPLVAFTGDGTIECLRKSENIKKAKVLITEVTFFETPPEASKMDEFGHIHIEDFAQEIENLQNELIIISHVSSRYKREIVLKVLKEKLPQSVRDRVMLWI